MDDKIIGQFFYEASLEEADIRSVKKAKNGKVVMEVALQDVETLNRNNRKYKKKAIEEAIKSQFIQEKLRTNSLLGEFNHPDASTSVSRKMQIDMRNVSHVIKSVYWENGNPNTLLGIVETAGTACGKDLAGLILENDMQCSFSMRGAGDFIQHKGFVEVTGPLKIVTWDCVHFPSHQIAYARKIMDESSVSDIYLSDLAQYIGESSDSNGFLAEDIALLGHNEISYTIEEGKVVIHEKETGKPVAWHTMTKAIHNEYLDALMKF